MYWDFTWKSTSQICKENRHFFLPPGGGRNKWLAGRSAQILKQAERIPAFPELMDESPPSGKKTGACPLKIAALIFHWHAHSMRKGGVHEASYQSYGYAEAAF